MFLNENNIDKLGITYHPGDAHFTSTEMKISFDEIISLYTSSTDHFTNRVFEGNLLFVTLILGNGSRKIELKADSNHDRAYRLLSRLLGALEKFRRNRFDLQFEQGEQIDFQIQNQPFFLTLREKNIIVNYQSDTVDSFEVVEISPNKPADASELILKGINNLLTVKSASISDQAFFCSEARKMHLFQEYREPSYWRYGRLAALALFVLLGLNGWFLAGDGPAWFDTVSLFAGIILAVIMVVKPVFWMVNKWNARNMTKAYLKRQG